MSLKESKKLKLVEQFKLSQSLSNCIRYKLQISVSKLLLLILGSSGGAMIISSNHINILFTFVQDAIRQGESEIQNSDGKFHELCIEVDEIRRVLGHSTSDSQTNYSAEAWLLHAAHVRYNYYMHHLKFKLICI